MLSEYFAVSEIVQKLKADKSGATAIEYGLIASDIAVAILAAIGLIGDELATLFNDLAGDTRCLEVVSNCKK